MALSIATNTAALQASAAASSVNRDLETSMARLSTGKRINSASDDAAGVAIASRLTAEIHGTDQAIRNALDGQALIDTAEGGHFEIEAILQRMREVAVQGANDTNDVDDRANLNAEMRALIMEIDRIASVTTWAGQAILAGGNEGSASDQNVFSLQVGTATGSKNQIKVSIDSMSPTGLLIRNNKYIEAIDLVANLTRSGFTYSVTAANTETTIAVSNDEDGAHAGSYNDRTIAAATKTRATIASELVADINGNNGLRYTAFDNGNGTFDVTKSKLGVNNHSVAKDAIKLIDAAIKTVNTQRSDLGAISNRLSHTVSNMTNISTNLSAARGGIEDADFAVETINLAKNQILQQASTAMLAQANASKMNVLSLLQN
jgi:flagellin